MVQFSHEVQLKWWQASLMNYFSWWSLVVVLVVVAVGGWLAVYPLYSNWRTMTKAEQLQTDYNINNQKFSNLKVKIKEWQNLRDSSESDLHVILPHEADLANLMAEIDAVVKASGFKLQGLTFTDSGARDKAKKTTTDTTSGLHTVSLFIDVSGGDYVKFKGLVTQIQSAVRLLEIKNVSFSSDDTYSMELVSYYFPQ